MACGTRTATAVTVGIGTVSHDAVDLLLEVVHRLLVAGRQAAGLVHARGQVVLHRFADLHVLGVELHWNWNIGTLEHWNIWTFGHLDIWTFGHLNI